MPHCCGACSMRVACGQFQARPSHARTCAALKLKGKIAGAAHSVPHAAIAPGAPVRLLGQRSPLMGGQCLFTQRSQGHGNMPMVAAER